MSLLHHTLRRILALHWFFFCAMASVSHAATVNWLDPLAYKKPAAIDITLPNEASATKYYVDFTAGADSPACGPAPSHPCLSLRGLADRNLPGLSGNARGAAAYVYVRG